MKWLGILLGTLRSAVKCRRDLALENLALRQQLAVIKQAHPRPRLSRADRLFWIFCLGAVVGLARCAACGSSGYGHSLAPPRYYWRWKSRRRGRPSIDPEIIQLIRRMCRANPLWGAPRIHGELLKVGIEISETTVAKYMVKRGGPPSQGWRTFLLNHAKETIALDFFTVPTATFKVLFVLIVLSHERRRILHFNATEGPTAAWTACGVRIRNSLQIALFNIVRGTLLEKSIKSMRTSIRHTQRNTRSSPREY